MEQSFEKIQIQLKIRHETIKTQLVYLRYFHSYKIRHTMKQKMGVGNQKRECEIIIERDSEKYCNNWIQMAKIQNVVYNQIKMNSNFYWQSPYFQFFPENPNPFYLNSLYSNLKTQEIQEPSYDELMRKCQQLENQNSQLKEELSNQQRIHIRKHKRVVKRRKQEELQKTFKCPHANCKKQYASSLALNLHIKNKHFQEYLSKSQQKTNQMTNQQQSIKNENELSSTM